jgi:MoaA/NifB/PqqE/SkfB family radical SAM enzyme
MNRFIQLLMPGIKYLILRVTNKCNAGCPFCLNHYYQNLSAGDAPELSVDEYEKIARKLKGLLLLNLSGGEPYLRPDLFAIADAFVSQSGVRLISSPTNGSCPDRVLDFAGRILGRHNNVVLKIGISIDAVGPHHDQIRGLARGYENALATARELSGLKKKYPQLMVHAVTTVTGENAHCLDALLAEISGLKLFDEHSLTLVRGSTPETRCSPEVFAAYRRACARLKAGKSDDKSLQATLFRSILKTMAADIEQSYLAQKNSFRCVAAQRMINISEQGNVCLCEILPDPVLGNLRDHEYDLNRILALPPTGERLQQLRRNGCNCHWDCAIYGSLLFGGMGGYRKIAANLLGE